MYEPGVKEVKVSVAAPPDSTAVPRTPPVAPLLKVTT